MACSNFHVARSLNELAVKLFGFGNVEAMQLMGQPTVAAVGKHREYGVEIHVESNFAGQTIQMKKLTLVPNASSTPLRRA